MVQPDVPTKFELTHRMLPQNEGGCIPQSQIVGFLERIPNVSAFAQTSPILVLLLLRRPNLLETRLDIRRKLESRAMERASLF
jgi:predicted RNase H-like nuclease